LILLKNKRESRMLFIRIKRKATSYHYKRDEKKNDWMNNDLHSCEDSIELYDDEAMIFSAKCQSVSNIPTGRYEDTIAEGPFLLNCFVDQRSFYPRIHGFCDTYDIENQYIDTNSVEENDKNRWLLHDDQKLKPNPPNQITRIPWSAGCVVLHKGDLEAFNRVLDAYNIKRGDTIDGEILGV